MALEHNIYSIKGNSNNNNNNNNKIKNSKCDLLLLTYLLTCVLRFFAVAVVALLIYSRKCLLHAYTNITPANKPATPASQSATKRAKAKAKASKLNLHKTGTVVLQLFFMPALLFSRLCYCCSCSCRCSRCRFYSFFACLHA